MQVVEGYDFIMGSDRRLVTLCVGLLRTRPRRARQKRTKCGKWLVDYTKALPALNDLLRLTWKDGIWVRRTS